MLKNLLNIFKYESGVVQKNISRGYKMRGKPPGVARSLEQRLAELNYKDPAVYYKVDIGFPPPKRSRKAELEEQNKQLQVNKRLESEARNLTLNLSLEDVKEEWARSTGPYHLKMVADHYAVFEDLFGEAYFLPCVTLDINYKLPDGALVPVHRGNIIKPTTASKEPVINFNSDSKDLWTLVLTNPDGHFTQENKEYIHWMIGNIPGNNLQKGEVIFDYLQPFPTRGTGFQRFIFILYKQTTKLDYSSLKKSSPCLNLKDRTFETLEFYRQRQDELTPAGLAFYQSDWDSNLTEFYHNVLKMREPVFEYDHDPQPIRAQQWFPKRRPFNVYLDRYRDQKQIAKEFLLKRLKNVEPFKKPETLFPYPNALPYDYRKLPSWYITADRKTRLGYGKMLHVVDQEN